MTISDSVGDGTGDVVITFTGGESVTLLGLDARDLDDDGLASLGIPYRNLNDLTDGFDDGSIVGSSGDDTIVGGTSEGVSDGGTVIHDTVIGGAGDDSILGGDGHDVLSGDGSVPNAIADVSRGANNSILISLDDGRVIRVTGTAADTYDEYRPTSTSTGDTDSGGINDGRIQIDALLANADNSVHIFEDSTGEGFSIAPGAANSLLVTRENGQVIRIEDGYFNTYDEHRVGSTTGGTDDGLIDIEAVASNADNYVHIFHDSTGQDFEVIGGADASLLVVRENGDVLRIHDNWYNTYDGYRVGTNSGGANDGQIDVEALATNLDAGVHRFHDSSGGDFSVARGAGDSLLITRDDGTVVRIDDDYYDTYDAYTTTGTSGGANDGQIDVEALVSNADTHVHIFEDSSGGSFTVSEGARNSLIIARDNGEVMRIHDTWFNTYDAYTETGTSGGTNDGRIDVEHLSANADYGVWKFVDSSGLDFTVEAGSGSDLTYGGQTGTLLITRENGETIQISDAYYDTFDTFSAEGTSGGTNDGVIDIALIAENADTYAEIYQEGEPVPEAAEAEIVSVERGDADSLLVSLDDGSVLRIADSTLNTYDLYQPGGPLTASTTTGGANDGVVGLDALLENVDSGAIHRFVDAEGGDFTVKAGDNYSLLITRDNGEVLRIPDYYLNNFDTFQSAATTTGSLTSGGTDDGAIDINALSANANSYYISKFTDSSGGDFSVEAGDSDSLLITRDNGEVLRIQNSDNSAYGTSSYFNSYDLYTTEGTSGGSDDGVVDVEALSANADSGNIYKFTDSTGQGFTVKPGDSDTLLIARDNGEVLRIVDASLNSYDQYATFATTTGNSTTDATNDGTIDVEALSFNADAGGVYKYVDSTGGSFTMAGGDAGSLLITRDSGEVLYVTDAYQEYYDTFSTTGTTGGDNDGTIDIEAISENVDNYTSYKFIDTTGESFEVTSGASDSLIITRANGEILRIQDSQLNTYDQYNTTVVTGGNSTTNGANDGVIDVEALSFNVDAGNVYRIANSVFQGGSGDSDAISLAAAGAPGDDTIDGGSGNDSIEGDQGDDSLLGGTGNDTIDGGTDDDRIDGGAGVDSILGGSGDDVIAGGADKDTLSGGAGNDTFVIADGTGRDRILDFTLGEDRLDLSGLTSDGGTTPVNTDDYVLTDTVGNGTGHAVLTFPGGEAVTLVGWSTDDVTHTNLLAMGFPQGSYHDMVDDSDDGTIIASANGDEIYGGNSKAAPDGGVSVNDTIFAGTGDDTAVAGDGDDSVDAGSGNDTVFAGSGSDIVYGGLGNDSLFTGTGNDTLFGGAGDDSLANSTGNDTLFGGAGNDSLVASLGEDVLYGGVANDALFGGEDNDSLYGGTGNDTLEGGTGDDVLYGGSGDDVFVVSVGGGSDTASDFGTGNDSINTSGATDLGNALTDQDGIVTADEITVTGGGGSDQVLHFPTGETLIVPDGTIDTSTAAAQFASLVAMGVPPCFAPGTRILTPSGERAVENLRVGELVMTADHGPRRIRWLGKRNVDFTDPANARGETDKPILIKMGALGTGMPRRDLIVSPQHRMVLSADWINAAFGEPEVFVIAKALTELAGVRILKGRRQAVYMAILLDHHEVIFAEGAKTESFRPGPVALSGFSHEHRRQIYSIYPGLA